MKATDICELAAELAEEHGATALDYAQRVVVTFESEGALERANFWRALSAFLDDIFARRLDPASPIVIN